MEIIPARIDSLIDEEDVVRLSTQGLRKPPFLKTNFDSDAEALDLFNTQYLLVKMDTMNERIDFPWEAGPRNIGYYCATTTLSDIAAVGGRPLGLLAGWSFPSEMNRESIAKILVGFRKAIRDCRTHLLGGDTNFAGEFSVSVACLGVVSKNKMLRRYGSKEGDLIGITGYSGRFNSSCIAHRSNSSTHDLDAKAFTALPRLGEGKLLASTNRVTSCIDTVDGLDRSLRLLLEPAGLGAHIIEDAIPVNKTTGEFLAKTKLTRYEIASAPAGDLELLFTVPRKAGTQVETLLRRNNIKFGWIGGVARGKGIFVHRGSRIVNVSPTGFVHHKGRFLFKGGITVRRRLNIG